jgi:hypothetical protein
MQDYTQEGRFYRMMRPTLGVCSDTGERIPIIVPIGAFVKIIKPEGTFVEVKWDERQVFMFALDLSERGELVQVVGAGQSAICK